MNGTIVCASEQWDDADATLGVALQLAERFDTRVVVVTASDSDRQDGVRARSRSRDPSSLAAPLAGDRAEGRIERRVVRGDVVGATVQVAEEEAAGLVVFGARTTRRRRRLRAMLERRLATAAPCPVLVVPPAAGLRPRSRRLREVVRAER